jgi:microcystin-dependent protein
MPVVGEIATFAFDNTKPQLIDRLRQQGWVACEGQSVAQVDGPNGLPHLYEAIGNAWGSDDPNAFNIPDFRGQFLRGWSHGDGNPTVEADARHPLRKGGAAGNKVGSAQDHQFAAHNHGIRGGTPVAMLTPSDDMCATHPSSPQERGSAPMMQGGPETRPRNVYIMYCIFTGHAPLPRQVKFFAS